MNVTITNVDNGNVISTDAFSIASFRDIKIQLDNKAEKTQTKERINMLVQFPLFVSSQPRYQAKF